jgi:hypothetical protein
MEQSMAHYLNAHGIQYFRHRLHIKLESKNTQESVDADPGVVKEQPVQRGEGEQIDHEHRFQVANRNLSGI